jgi:hypothetical protein
MSGACCLANRLLIDACGGANPSLDTGPTFVEEPNFSTLEPKDACYELLEPSHLVPPEVVE